LTAPELWAGSGEGQANAAGRQTIRGIMNRGFK